MKKFIALFLVFSLTMQCLSSLGVLAWYGINLNYIATVLCENKNMPELDCMGQCVLMKKLQSLEDSNQHSEDTSTHRLAKVESPFFILPDSSLPKLLGLPLLKGILEYKSQYSFIFCERKFNPPRTSF